MYAIVSESIRICDCTSEYRKYLEDKYTFDNPEYYRKLNMGKWVGDTPQKLSLIQRDGNEIIVPFGELPHLFSILEKFDYIGNLTDNHTETKDWGSTVVPYPYQKDAIEKALKKRQGVIVAPCSSGKTQIGLEVASRLKKKALWLTHTHDLLKQSKERAQSIFTNLSGDDYGEISGGKVDIGNVITFATVQTMSNIDLALYKNCWDVIIVDECHHIAGTPTKIMMFYKVISNLCARYKFGLTATPERADGLTGCMFALLGDKVHEIMRDEISNTSCPVEVEFHYTGYEPDFEKILMPDGTLSHVALINEMVEDENRNRAIVNDVVNADGTCLVLTDRVSHATTLAKMICDDGFVAVVLSGSSLAVDKKIRATAIADLNNNKIKAVVATFALAKEGLDVKSLRNIFFTTPQKNKTIVTQSAGRVARKAEGKDCGVVHDYVDESRLMYGWAKKRKNIYKSLGYTIHDLH